MVRLESDLTSVAINQRWGVDPPVTRRVEPRRRERDQGAPRYSQEPLIVGMGFAAGYSQDATPNAVSYGNSQCPGEVAGIGKERSQTIHRSGQAELKKGHKASKRSRQVEFNQSWATGQRSRQAADKVIRDKPKSITESKS